MDADDYVPYQKHSEPSREAAVEMTPAAKTLESACLDLIKGAGATGLTDEELYFAMQRKHCWAKESTVRARRVGLRNAGLVVPAVQTVVYVSDVVNSNCFVTRETRAGRNAQVWVAA